MNREGRSEGEKKKCPHPRFSETATKDRLFLVFFFLLLRGFKKLEADHCKGHLSRLLKISLLIPQLKI